MSGFWVAVGPQIHSGQGTAKYAVVNVIYAPPGSAAGGQSGSVTYSSQNTFGTTISASQSFKTTNSISTEYKGEVFGDSSTIESSSDTDDTQEIDLKHTSSYSESAQSPKADGIDHTFDQITLVLNPKINLELSSNSAEWYPSFNGCHLVTLTVGQLQHPETISSGTLSELANAGITQPDDFKAILAHDPLATAGATPDPSRYVYYGGYRYDPGVPDSQTQTLTYASTTTATTAATDTYSVGITLSTTLGFIDFAKTTLKSTDTWEWTNKSSNSVDSGSQQTASFTLVSPSATWPGAVWLEVYFDRVFNTFAFDLVPPSELSLAAKGKVVDAHNLPVNHREVSVTVAGKTYKTWTGSDGQYELYLPGLNRISVGNATQPKSTGVEQPTITVTN